MKMMTLGRGAAPVAMLLLTACGGGGSFEKAVPFKATLEAGSPGDQITMIVTRSSHLPDIDTDCRLDVSTPSWCTANFQTLSFNVQPSYTLYRVYVRNLSLTNAATAKVTVFKDGERQDPAVSVVPAGQDRWYWELGINTTNNKTD